MTFFQNIEKQKFLSSFWEKEHLFMPASFPAPKISFSREEILNMATDEDLESRLVTQDSKGNWDLEFGPIESTKSLRPNKKWTLFIHNFNLMETFSNRLQMESKIIPNWLFDDVLCSVSTDGASVGAHFDRYNVFIIQISGSRIWKIQNKPEKKFRKDCAIKVLETFKPDVEYLLKPGDMIFIPPECGHEGTSVGDSISLSLGFKSLENTQIMEFFASEILESINEDEFIKTEIRDFAEQSFEVTTEFTKRIYEVVLKKIGDINIFEDAFMKFLTQPKTECFIENPEMSFSDFISELAISQIQFAEETRYLKYKNKLWINKSALKVEAELINQIIEIIESQKPISKTNLNGPLQEALYELFKQDVVGFID